MTSDSTVAETDAADWRGNWEDFEAIAIAELERTLEGCLINESIGSVYCPTPVSVHGSLTQVQVTEVTSHIPYLRRVSESTYCGQRFSRLNTPTPFLTYKAQVSAILDGEIAGGALPGEAVITNIALFVNVTAEHLFDPDTLDPVMTDVELSHLSLAFLTIEGGALVRAWHAGMLTTDRWSQPKSDQFGPGTRFATTN